MNDACFSNDSNPSISSIGSALMALDKELDDLTQQDEVLMCKRLHIHQKMKICTESIKKLLLAANGGVYPRPCPDLKFPELHMID